MGWKENKQAYVKTYVKEAYHRVTLQIRKDDKNPIDKAIWEAIKDEPNKSAALKKLICEGLHLKD